MASKLEPTIEPKPSATGGAEAVAPLLFQLHEDNPQKARVAAAQQLLFPTNPRIICEELGLNWWAMLKLYEDGWLSFSPEHTLHLDEAQEAEVRFIGSLVLAGCDRNLLTVLLAGLAKPYAYDLRRLYFDWTTHAWRLLPDPRAHPEAAFTDWLDLLVQTGDVASLTGIVELAQDALSRVRHHGSHPVLHPKHHHSVTTDEEQVQG